MRNVFSFRNLVVGTSALAFASGASVPARAQSLAVAQQSIGFSWSGHYGCDKDFLPTDAEIAVKPESSLMRPFKLTFADMSSSFAISTTKEDAKAAGIDSKTFETNKDLFGEDMVPYQDMAFSVKLELTKACAEQGGQKIVHQKLPEIQVDPLPTRGRGISFVRLPARTPRGTSL